MSDLLAGMSKEEKQELIGEFLSESESHLQVLNDKLLVAEEASKSGKDISESDLNAMMRSAHTLKGTASFIGLNKIVEMMHDMESVMQKIKAGKIPLDPEVTDVLFKAFDKVEMLFKSLRSKGVEEGDISDSIAKLHKYISDTPIEESTEKGAQIDFSKQEAMAHAAPEASATKPEEETQTPKKSGKKKRLRDDEAAIEKYLEQFVSDTEQSIETFNEVLLIFEKERENTDRVNELFRITHTIKGTAGLVNANEIQKVSHCMENLLSYIRDNKKIPDPDVISELFEGIDTIKELLQFVKKREKCSLEISSICDKLDYSYAKMKGLIIDSSKSDSKDTSVASIKERVFNIKGLNEEEHKKLADSLIADMDGFGINFKIQGMIQMKSMKLLLIVEKLNKKGHIIKYYPTEADINDASADDINVGILYCSTLNEKEIKVLVTLDGVKIDSIERFSKSELGIDEKIIKGHVTHAHSETPRDDALTVVETKGANMETIPMPEKTNLGGIGGMGSPPGGQQAGGGNKPNSGIEMTTIRVDSNKIDNLMNLSSELVIIRARFAQLVSQLNEEIMNQREIGTVIESIKDNKNLILKEVRTIINKTKDESGGKKVNKLFDDLDIKLDEFEGITGNNKIVSAIHSLDEITSSLGKISSDIQSGIMQTRMIPIEGIFTRFKRIIRDISKELGKEVNLKIEGEDTELDKKIVDSLGDPLTHMIRNSVDHGIEDKETRKQAGKNEVGTILLKASHRGNNICIEVGDDGKGLNPEKIVSTAVKKGIIKTDDATVMTDRQKIDLIFLPGFSTAEKVTGISGRGVGMDVVKSMVTSVNGTIDIVSEMGKGSNFVLKIPLTLAIIQALLVVIGDEIYALPLDSVLEIIKVSEDEIYSIDGNDTVKLRGHALSLIELERIIKLAGTPSRSGSRKIVVISDGELQVGVVVDSLLGKDEIVIKSLTDHFSGVKGITGASILGDGRIALILDPTTIIREAR